MKNKKYVYPLFITLILLLFLKIDFRFQETVYCCGDDHDYYMHSETIGVDFDLDYSNQMLGIENRRFNLNDKIAPTGFIGTGIYSSPFLFFGHLLDRVLSGKSELSQQILNYRILFYSLSSVFYYFMTIFLTMNILKILKYKFKNYEVVLLYFGSGVAYYAFERFSMTHVYECFSCVLILYLSMKFYSHKNKKFIAFLIPFAIALGISVRWVNYFYLLLPYIAKSMIEKNNKINNYLLRSNYFYVSSFLSSAIFLIHTKILYGEYTFNPQFVYKTGGQVTNFISRDGSFITFLTTNITNLFKILFSQEFGLFWFSPAIFIGFFICVYNLVLDRKNRQLSNIIIFLSFSQVFLAVLLWRSTASSYGFRYLFCLIPLAIIIYFRFQNQFNNSLIRNYVIFFSVFSTISLLFFETTPTTQLSLVETTNTFGRYLKYTQPEYLSGYLTSFLELNSYLKIFTTSFLGAILFKLITLLITPNALIELLGKFGLPVGNQDFLDYIFEIQEINLIKFIIIFLMLYFISYFLISKNRLS